METPRPFSVSKQAYGEDEQQFGILRVPEGNGPHPVAIVIHGGFWHTPHDLTLMKGLAEDLSAHGIATWNIEYRRIGDEGGGWPNTLLDVARAADYLRELAPAHQLDLRRVVSLGHSAGGHLALWLAARPRIAPESPLAPAARQDAREPLALVGVVSQAGAADLELCWSLGLEERIVSRLLGGDPDAVPERYRAASPSALVPLGVPQMLVHGTQDNRVPLQVSQAYVDAAIAAGDEAILIELADVDHFALINPRTHAWRICLEVLQGLLTT